MQISKLVALILKIFLYSTLVNAPVFFLAVYIDSSLISIVLPANAHIQPTFQGAISYAIYNSIEMGLFFTSFSLLIIRLSIFSGTILTIRDIVRYYKKFIFTTFIFLAIFACSLCLVLSNLYTNKQYISKGLISGDIITYALPCFWLILAAVYYRSYQSKTNDPDGSKDRSWLEGNIES